MLGRWPGCRTGQVLGNTHLLLGAAPLPCSMAGHALGFRSRVLGICKPRADCGAERLPGSTSIFGKSRGERKWWGEERAPV